MASSPAPPSMAAQLEDRIMACYYGKEAAQLRARAHAVGLQCPLWMWTHDGEPSGTKPPFEKSRDVRKVCHLLGWLTLNQVDLSTVAVIVPLTAKAAVREEAVAVLAKDYRQLHGQRDGAAALPPSLPVFLAHHELAAMNRRDGRQHTYNVVIYLLGLPPLPASVGQVGSHDGWIADALAAAGSAFLFVCDSGWLSSHLAAKWPQWRLFMGKFRDVEPLVSGSPPAEGARQEHRGTLPSLVGSSLPLCCARHPNQRQLEYGLSVILSRCKHACLQLYDCGVTDHICTERCHPSSRHAGCPYACERPMACGHPCLLPCASACNCLVVVEKPLPCSHQVVLGLDPETLEPIYGTVEHVFRGVCADAALPCAVQYTSECGRCLGPIEVRCFEAQQHGHTSQNRVLLCDACKRTERELRAQILGEVLCGTEVEKRKLKTELQRALHQQRKAATQGLFTPGVKVEITDVTKCVPPLIADDFPDVEFVDMDEPGFYSAMEGAYGTFISSHVDIMDRSELRNLVRLPDNRHVLVTDGGLRMIRALTSGVTNQASARLMIAAGAHKDAGPAGKEAAGSSPEFAEARAMVGSVFYLAHAVPCADAPSGTIGDKVVTVVDIEPTAATEVMVECQLFPAPHTAAAAAASTVARGEEADVGAPATKKPRVEGAEEPPAAGGTVLRFTAPISCLESMKGYDKGQYVYVMNTERQVRDPHALASLQPAVDALLAGGPHTRSRLGAVLANENQAYELLGVVNPPQQESVADEEGEDGDVTDRAPRLGPCAILRPRTSGVPLAAARATSSLRRGGASRPQARPATAGAAAPLIAVPFLFTVPDELAEAENALDAAAQKQFEQRLEEAILARSEQQSLRNDEKAFYAQQQMGPVTAERREEQRTAFSVPVSPPTEEQVAAAKRRQLEFPRGSAVHTRAARMKELLLAKQEGHGPSKWLQEVQERLERDDEAMTLHIRALVAQQPRPGPPPHRR